MTDHTTISRGGQIPAGLDELPGPEDIDKVTDALVECATGDEFIERVRMG